MSTPPARRWTLSRARPRSAPCRRGRGLFRPALLPEVDDTVLGEQLEVVVNLPHVPIEAVGEDADALCRLVHRAPHRFEPSGREDPSEPGGVLDHVSHAVARLPSGSVQPPGSRAGRRDRDRRDDRRRGPTLDPRPDAHLGPTRPAFRGVRALDRSLVDAGVSRTDGTRRGLVSFITPPAAPRPRRLPSP